MGQTPRGPRPPPARCGDSLGLSLLLFKSSQRGRLAPLPVPAACGGRSFQRPSCAVHTGTREIPHRGLCLVCLADVLPEQMGRGNASLGHFCFAVRDSSIIFSPTVPDDPVCTDGLAAAAAASQERLPLPTHQPGPLLRPFSQRFTLLAIPVMKQAPD